MAISESLSAARLMLRPQSAKKSVRCSAVLI